MKTRQYCIRHFSALPINVVVASDIQKDDLPVCYDNVQCHAVFVSDTHGLDAFDLAAEVMKFKIRLKGIFFEIAQNSGKLFSQFRMSFDKFLRCTCKPGSPDQGEHSVFQPQLFY